MEAVGATNIHGALSKAMRDEMKATLNALQEWEPKGRASKAYDSLEALMKKPGKKLPALKDMLER